MNEKTLLDMLAKMMQPADAVSTNVEHGHSAIDKEIDKFGGYTMSQTPERKLVGQGLGMLDMVGGLSKAGALIPALTKKYVKSASGQSQVSDMIRKIAVEREILKASMTTPKGLSKSSFKNVITAKPSKMSTTKEGFELGSKENIMNQVYEKALEQYKQFGAARPGTEDFIQTLLKGLKKLK